MLMSVFCCAGDEWRSWLKAATSLTVTERHYTHMLWACRLQTFVTGASGGAWTWENIEATLALWVCSRWQGLQKGRLTPCCYVGRTEVRAKGQR
jgi:hypothetical protein